jgi:hypothetical protein
MSRSSGLLSPSASTGINRESEFYGETFKKTSHETMTRREIIKEG